MGIVRPGCLLSRGVIVRNHLEAILAFLIQALNVKHFVVAEKIGAFSRELSDRNIDQQVGLDLWGHRLTLAGDHLLVEVLLERDDHLSQVLGAGPDVLEPTRTT